MNLRSFGRYAFMLERISSRSGKPKDLCGILISAASNAMSLAEGGKILLTRGVLDSARQVL